MERPRPDKGQQWRDTQGGLGPVFTLDRRYPPSPTLGWCFEAGSNSYWPDHCFENGRLAFLGYAPGYGPAPIEGAPVVPRDEPAKWCGCKSPPCTCQTPVLASPVPDIYADNAFKFENGEKTHAFEGTPLTCLQRIQARKPPEPWRPSIDDWDLLPDVDVRR